MRRFFLAFGVCLLAASVASAQRQPGDPIKLEVSPAKASARPLRYAFGYEMVQQKSGNAATEYKEVAKIYKDAKKSEGQAFEEQLDAWMEGDLKDFPIKDVEAFFKKNKEFMPALEKAARRDQCDWGHREGLRQKGFFLLLPEIQDMRGLIRVVAVHSRLNLAQGKIEESLQDVRLGLVMARHVTESPILISSLVGIALTQVMLNRVDEIVQQPGAPNLYGALSDLPAPYVSMRQAIEGERLGVIGTLPGLADSLEDLNAGAMTEQQVQDCIKKMEQVEPMFGQVAIKEYIALNITLKHERAKKALIDAGRPKEKVEAMPHFQVALLHSLLSLDSFYDDMRVIQTLPPWEAFVKAQEFNRKVKQMAANGEKEGPAIPLARYILPAFDRVMRAQLRVDRRIAALRVVEAIRLYAAAHDGKLPASLTDIKDAKIPVDPLTGKAFEYQAVEKTAVLKGFIPPEEMSRPNERLTYEVTIRK
jgi:hypothetical protein